MLLAEGWRLAEQPQIELQASEGACSHRAEGTLTVLQRGRHMALPRQNLLDE